MIRIRRLIESNLSFNEFWVFIVISDHNIENILRVSIALGYTAHVCSSINSKVATSSPGSTPWILYNPIVLASLWISSISSCQNGMVDIFWTNSTSRWCVNTCSIVMESINNLESNWNWPIKEDCSFEFYFISLCNVDWTTYYCHLSNRLFVDAGTINSCVWISSLTG